MRPKSTKPEEGKLRGSWLEVLCFGFFCLQLWRKVVFQKWLSICSKGNEFSADEGDTTESESEYEGSHLDGISYNFQRTKSEIIREQYISIKEIRLCVGSWNVGGKLPPNDLEIMDWLDMGEPADIYVLGLQEIVELNAGNVFGAEDNRPVSRWKGLIHRALNVIRPASVSHKCYSDPTSSARFQTVDDSPGILDALLEGRGNNAEQEIHPLEEYPLDIRASGCAATKDSLRGSTIPRFTYSDVGSPHTFGQQLLTSLKMSDQPSYLSIKNLPVASKALVTDQKSQNKNLSISQRIGVLWPGKPLKIFAQCPLNNSKSYKPIKSFNRCGSFNSVNQYTKDFEVPNLMPKLRIGNGHMKKKGPAFVRIISKQMVGIYLTIWIRRSLRKHIQNLKVSTVGVGCMGCIGNKGSISVSMSIFETPFCFVCSHLTSGEKEADKDRRNSDVQEICRRTLFCSTSGIGLPKTIFDHERIFWLGDLNYRINLSCETVHDLISKKEWSKLSESDQLKEELKNGKAFDGWLEGVISFPPTYKYEINSDRYVGDDPNAGRRTPAWCDRILSYGEGIRLLDYRRTELMLSDHRPVTAMFMVDVEMLCKRKLQRALKIPRN
ncbi:hypothetical protein HPP92_009561 [Vanilla planifolia]|uniref:Inositol polyphosphate-related phosphatase domain-containing protein n=1 Tax=Vanilla planifolia TaxID=51239 RepID=A0A835V8Z2_VANPL|nr:hypothetical protein HPP92_009561 [Vanilla planifolia]